MSTNTLLTIVISLLTLNFLFVGIYVVLILRETHSIVQKMNSILEGVERVSESATSSLLRFSSFLGGFLGKLLRKKFLGEEGQVASKSKGGKR